MHVLCKENNRKSAANPLENDGEFQERNKLLIPPDVERKTYPSMKEMSKKRAGVRGLPSIATTQNFNHLAPGGVHFW